MKADVIKFLQATGNYKEINGKEVFFEEVGKLIPLIQEELNELKTSYDLRYVQGVLDDTLDLQVYNYQLQSLLERLGCNVIGAGEAIAENNSLKYTQSKELADTWLAEHERSSRMMRQECPFYISTNESYGKTWYCLKRKSDDKVSKYVGFSSVKLDKYIPKEFGGSK